MMLIEHPDPHKGEHQNSWKEGRSLEVVAFVEKMEKAIWEDPELTPFQRGYLAAEIGHIKNGGKPNYDIEKSFEEVLMLFKMFCIDCPP
jgi:hypothetical protein